MKWRIVLEIARVLLAAAVAAGAGSAAAPDAPEVAAEVLRLSGS